MTSALALVPKSTGLAKTDAAVRDLAARIERARETRNARVRRADADFIDAVRRAVAEIDPVVASSDPDPASEAIG